MTPIPTEVDGPPPVRDSLAVRVGSTTGFAVLTSHTGDPRWTNTAACLDSSTVCLGVPGSDPLALTPNLDLHDRRTTTRVGGVQLEPGFGGECSAPLIQASFDRSSDAIPVSIDGIPVELPALVPLVSLEAPEVEGQLSFRWEPAGQPMQLHLVPTTGPPIPVVLPVDDTGSLDLPYDQLGLHPDVLSFTAQLVRAFYGTAENDPPVDWSVTSSSPVRFIHSGGGRLRVTPEPLCSAATEHLQPGVYWLPMEAEGFVIVDPVPPGQVLRIHHGAEYLLAYSACGGPVSTTSFGDDLLLTSEEPVWLQAYVGTDGPVRLDLELEPEVVPVDFADTCAQVGAPLGSGVYRVDLATYTDSERPSLCDGQGLSTPPAPDSILPVVVPPGAVLTVTGAVANWIALREDCEVTDVCLADTYGHGLTWKNEGTEPASLFVAVEWAGRAGLADLEIAIEQPTALAPVDGCDGPVLQRSRSIEGSVEGLEPSELGGCWWPAPPDPDGTYRLELDAGEKVQIDANWRSGNLELLEDCGDLSSVVARGWSSREMIEPLVFENSGAAHTYTLRVQGDVSPFVLRVR